MLRGTSRWAVLGLLAAFTLALALSACGGGGSSESTAATESSEGSERAAGGESTVSTESEGGQGESAEEIIAPFVGQPGPFPVSEDLKEVPEGADIAYVDHGTPFSALLFQLASEAAKTMGVHLEHVKAGASASEVAAAFDTVLAKQPDAVIVNGIPIEEWSKSLKELQEAGIKVVPSGVLDTEEYGVEFALSSNAEDEQAGRLMAGYAAAKMQPNANVVIYDVPEASLTKLIGETATTELERLCSGCSVRTVHIGASELGTTAPNTVVSDLQANPETNVALFTTDDIELGLPAALKAAGIEIETLGYAPEPSNLEYLKEEKETAVLAYDAAVLGWTQVDLAARLIVGQEPTGPEAEGVGVMQFLTPKEITFDPSHGWTGYPEFAERFAKLWGLGK